METITKGAISKLMSGNNAPIRPPRPATSVPDFLFALAMCGWVMAAIFVVATFTDDDLSAGDAGTDLARLFASRFGASVALAHHVPLDAVACVDRDQVTQALWALLQNGAEAALAAPSPCQVDLSMACGAGHLTVRVCDTGPGIKASNRVRIFRPFFTTKPHGSGIGLSLARRIARAHGGDLTLLALSATTFELRLPAS